ncbi:MAG: cysteine desulfurase family protein [Planctomycetaceae bacterium]
MTTKAAGACAPDLIYLDHAAATPLLPEVAAAMTEARAAAFANPSSPHAAGRRARHLLEDARERILALVGTDLGPGAALVFTSGATEANRLGILGLATESRGRVLVSARDHSSGRAAARELVARGWEQVDVPLRADGTLALPVDAAEETAGAILSATLVCGQSGSREDALGLAAWAAARPGRRVHLDATQAMLAGGGHGTGTFGLPPAAATTLALAPHKFGGPRGIGGLVVRHGVALAAVVPATQESGLRGGTEAVDLAVGFARALEVALVDRERVARQIATLRDRLETGLLAAASAAGSDAVVIGGDSPRAPHVATVAFPGLDRQALVMAADLEGVCCATGTACASGSSEPAPALVAMGLSESIVAGAVRLSLGPDTTAADVDAAAERLGRVLARMARRAGG